MGAKIIKFGFWVILAGLVVLVAGSIWLKDSPSVSDVARYLLLGGGGLAALGVLLWLVEKAGLAIFQRKCARCNRLISRGHVYCADHLKESIEQAREKLHRERGTGI